MNFGEALEAAKTGELITRSGWNGKGMFLFVMELQMPQIKSAWKSPANSALESYFEKLCLPKDENGEAIIKIVPFLCMKAADNSIVPGWLASQTDMLAEDWQLFSEINGAEEIPPGGFRAN